MIKTLLLTAGAVAGLSASAMAVPLADPAAGSRAPLAEPVASWRYNKNCAWNNGRWVVDLGRGKIVVCRPVRPGREWSWHREGNREGWWDRRRHVWHYQKW